MPAINLNRPVELSDGTPLSNVRLCEWEPTQFSADVPDGYSAAYDGGCDTDRLFVIADGRHLYGSLPAARNVINGELPDVPERKPEEVRQLDLTQPMELVDGTPVSLRQNDGTSIPYCFALLTASTRDHRAGYQFWTDRKGHCDDFLKVRNVDPNIPAYLTKARHDWLGQSHHHPDFTSEDWFAPHKDVHFPLLVERDDIAMISFFENERKLEADRRTEMRVGRYVRRFNGGKLKDEDVERVAAASDVKLRGNRVKITQDADEIEQVYIHGPSSCMAGRASRFSTDGIHPARVYAGPDLAVAYLGEPDDPSSRCVVWPEKKVYSTIYGDCTRMEQMLQNMGYTEGDVDGARVQLIECAYGIVMPYVDGVSWAEVRGEYVKLGYGDIETERTDGLGNDDSNRCTCERCDDRVDSDETHYVRTSRHYGETWCDYCAENYAHYCENFNYGTTVSEDSCVEVHNSTGSFMHPDWDLGDYVRVTAGDHEDEYWHVDVVASYDGEAYHVDDLPEGAEIDDRGIATVEEAEAAGQMALPLTGEYRLMGRELEGAPFPCVLEGAAGPASEYRYAGTLEECERNRQHITALYPEPRYHYWIEPVPAAATDLADRLAIAA